MMAGEAKGGGRPLLRLLKALSRPAAAAEVEAADSKSPERIRVIASVEGTLHVLHHASAEVWQRAVTMRLVAQRSDALWEIAAPGRERLAAARLPAASPKRPATSDDKPGRPSSADPACTQRRADRPIEAPSESPLAWLRRRRDKSGEPMISAAQYEAGERLRADFERALLMPRLTVDWNRAASGGSRHVRSPAFALDLNDSALAARQRVNHALGALGPELASVMVDVCCHLKGLEQLERSAGWPQRSAKIVLSFGLSALARHYGIERQKTHAGPARVLHWGAEGYRPELDCDDRDRDGQA